MAAQHITISIGPYWRSAIYKIFSISLGFNSDISALTELINGRFLLLT